MYLTIERLNGETFDLSPENDLIVTRFNITSPEFNNYEADVPGRNGTIDLGSDYLSRKIETSIEILSKYGHEFPLLRDIVFRLFSGHEAFYLIDSRQSNKRWLVKPDGTFTPEQIGDDGAFDVTFISHSPFSESRGTTLNPFTFSSGLWSFGMGLTLSAEGYTHNTSTFSIYNAGDEDIDPSVYPLKIQFKGASTNLKIENLTTGETWTYTGTTNSGDTVLLDRLRSTKNGLTIYRNTNRKKITIKQGENNFRVSGATGSFTISFEFKFYSL